MSAGPRHTSAPQVRSWAQRLTIAVGVLLSVLLVGTAAAVGYIYWKTGRFARADVPLDQAAEGAPRNYLIIGSDSRANIDPNDPAAGGFLGGGAEQTPTGQRSDTILLVRIDPQSGRIDMLSFPRDLWVPIAGTTGSAKINSAYGRGRAVLVDTIRQVFDVPINNYIEVDFAGFQSLVNAIGGIDLWFPSAVRDLNTGLDVGSAGCVHLDGQQALAFARSRHFEVRTRNGRWEEDATQDLGRIKRQQVLVRKAVHKAFSFDFSNPLEFNQLLDVAVDSVTIDQTIDRGDMKNLADRFKSTSDADIVSHSLTVRATSSPDGQSIVVFDPKQARSVLNVFRGVPPGQVSESDVTVDVRNGTGVHNQARDVAAAFGSVGFTTGTIADERTSHTIVRYAPGSEPAADLVLRHLSSPAALEVDPKLGPDEVMVVTGPDFTTVTQAPLATAVTTPSTAAPSTTAASTTTAPASTTTTLDPFLPGTPPDGTTCG